MASIGTPYKLDGPRVAANPQDRHVLRLHNRIVVITADGRVFAHDLAPESNEVGKAVQLTGPKVAANPQDKLVIAVGDTITVITAEGRVSIHVLRQGSNRLGRAEPAGGAKVGANPQDKFVVGLADVLRWIFVTTMNGSVFSHPIIDYEGPPFVTNARQLNGPKVAANPEDKRLLIMARRQRIVVITTDGSVFAHDLGSSEIGSAYQLTGPKVAANPQDRFVLEQTSPRGNRILVITADGSVFAHDIEGFPVPQI